jgi:hypothetical protein
LWILIVNKFFSLFLSVGLSLGLPLFAVAEEVIEVQSVKILGYYDNAIGTSDAASQGAVNASRIASRNLFRVGELLEFVPGLIVSQHSGDGKANQYFLRGFNLDHGTDFATYIDGVPINMRSHAHGQGYTDLNFLIPELVNRIDYKKGPYFADEGDFSSAGAAHIRLFSSLDAGIANLTVGENAYKRVVLANSIAALNGQVLFGVELNQNNGPFDTPERIRKFSGLLRYSNGSLKNGYSLTAMAYKNRWNASDQLPLRAVQSGQVGRFGAIDTSDGGKSSRYSLSYALHQQDDESTFTLDAYAVQSDLDLFSNFSYFLNNPENGDQFNQSEKRRFAGINVSQTWLGTISGLDTRNKIGAQGRIDRVAPIGLYETTARVRTATTREDKVNEASIGLYAENLIQWFPTFRSVAGIRYDRYRFKVASSLQGNSGLENDAIFSPKLSLIFGPWAKTEYFLNFGKGFHSNDARGITQTRLSDGNPTKPATPLVKTRGAELGVRTEIVPSLTSSFAIWTLSLASELVFVGDAGDTEAGRASRRHGLEWSTQYAATPWLFFNLDLTSSRARYKDFVVGEGNFIPGSIDKVASFGATLSNLGNWSGGVELRHFGARPLTEDNTVRSKPTTLAYARVAYQLSNKIKIALDVFNLFDKSASDIDYYYLSRLRGEPAEGVNDIHFHPAEPRNFRLSLAYNF